MPILMIDNQDGGGIMDSGVSGTVDQHSILVTLATGFLDLGNNVLGSIYAGISKADYVAGDKAEFWKDRGFKYPTAAAAQTDVGQIVYAAASGTVSLTAGNGVVIGKITKVGVGDYWEITPFVDGPIVMQATTSATGEIAIAGLTTGAIVQVTAAEDLGANLVIADAIATAGVLTINTRNTNTDAYADLNAKAVNVTVWSK